jgi:hypothetical protein
LRPWAADLLGGLLRFAIEPVGKSGKSRIADARTLR